MILDPRLLQPLSADEIKRAYKGVRILIADDHPFVLELAVEVLEQHFAVVGTATDGKILVEEALRLRPDIIVSDIVMPSLSGLDAARVLREGGCAAKIIFLSVYEREEFIRACFSEGGVGYVTKAKIGTDLVMAVRAVISGRQFVSPSVQEL
jgi:DNA-binding NarL/FixJ family response regulator